MTTDEMSLLLEAFSLEAGDHVTELRRTLDKLDRSPGNVANWRKAVASFRIVADSAVMMELPEVQLLARLGQEACQFMTDHADRQQPAMIKPLKDGADALGRYLESLMKPKTDRAALDEGQAAFATWHHLANVGSSPALGTLPELAGVVSEPPPAPSMPSWVEAGAEQLAQAAPPAAPAEPVVAPAAPVAPVIEPVAPPVEPMAPVAQTPEPADQDARPQAQPPRSLPTRSRSGRRANETGRTTPGKTTPPAPAEPLVARQPAAEATPTPVEPPPAVDQVISERPEVMAAETPATGAPTAMPATPAIDELLAEHTSERPAATEEPPGEGTAEPIARLARWRRVLPRRAAESETPLAEPATAQAAPDTSAPAPELASPPAVQEPIAATAPATPAADVVVAVVPLAETSIGAAEIPPVDAVAAPAEANVEATDQVIATEPLIDESVSDAIRLEINAELLEIFVEEVGEHLLSLDEHMATLREAPTDVMALRETRRSLHTLKGAASMIGVEIVQKLGWISEETVEELYLDHDRPATPQLLELLEATIDALRTAHGETFSTTSLTLCAEVTTRWHGLAAELRAAEAADTVLAVHPMATPRATEPSAIAAAAEIAAEPVEVAAEPSAIAAETEITAEPLEVVAEPSAIAAEAEVTAEPVEVVAEVEITAEPSETAPEPVEIAAEAEMGVDALVVEAEDQVLVVTTLAAEAATAAGEAVAAMADDAAPVVAEDQVLAVQPLADATTTLAAPTAAQPGIDGEVGDETLLSLDAAPEPTGSVSMDVVPAIERLVDHDSDDDEAVDRLIETDTAAAAASAQLSEQDQLRSIFAGEADEGLQQVDELMAQLKPGANTDVNGGVLRELLRQIHTLKGAAAMMSQEGFAGLAHRMEDLLDQLSGGSLPLTPAVVGLLYDTLEVLRTIAGGTDNGPATNVLTTRYTAALSAAQATRMAAAPAAPATSSGQSNVASVVRLDIEQLNELMGLAEELVTNRAGFEEQLSLMAGLLRDFERSVERLARVSRSLEYDYEAWGVAAEQPVVEDDEFDSLEFDRYTEFARLTGEMAESVADARTISRDITARVTSLNALVGRQGRVVTSMRERMERARLISLTGLMPVARRLVYQTAQFESKQVEIDTRGLEVPVDRTIYDAVSTALGHILRNAIAHGIEDPDERQRAGKAPVGQIVIEGRQAQYETIIVIRDDGRGIDRARVRAAAEEDGYITPGQELADDEVLNLIFRSGLSTSEAIDQVAGRGVGMDAAQAAVASVRGRIEVASKPGEGTVFTLHLPLLMTVADVLLVDCSKYRLALPMTWLNGTMRVDTSELIQTPTGHELDVAGERLAVLPLAELLGWPVDLKEQAKWPAVIAQAGDRRIVLLTDALVQRQELAISSLGPSFGWLRSVQGAAILGNGQVAPVLDLIEVIERGRAQIQARRVEARAVRVLVCDDSVSVRRVVSMALVRQGWEVVQARNGHEALAAIAAGPIDLALLDIEMPQMDGYALLERLRTDTHYAHIPVAMLTSRGAEKHRQRAFELGAQAYLVKPYKEDFLLTTLNQLLAGQSGIGSEMAPTAHAGVGES